MKFTRFRKIAAGTLAAVAATLLVQISIAQGARPGALRINFEKCFNAQTGRYEGTVSGDLGVGTVIFTFESVVPGDVIWRFSGVYTITTDQATIEAFAEGIDNLRSGSGHDVLNGEVTAGDYLGAQVHVRAHDFNDGNCSQGTITITPRK